LWHINHRTFSATFWRFLRKDKNALIITTTSVVLVDASSVFATEAIVSIFLFAGNEPIFDLSLFLVGGDWKCQRCDGRTRYQR